MIEIPVAALAGAFIGGGAFGVLFGFGLYVLLEPRVAGLQAQVADLRQKVQKVEAERDHKDRGMTDWARAAFGARETLFDIEKRLAAVRSNLEAKGIAPRQEQPSAT